MRRPCEACGHRGALFAAQGAGGGPPVVRCGPCLERLRPFRMVELVQSGVSVAPLTPRRWREAMDHLVEEMAVRGVVTMAAALGEAWEQGRR